ncbi:major facilitator superfamily MFS_1 [Paenibacillus vortex V453]|uniref:MFS transporter n=2 Tax=Paenibacillus TaxID=44249 RepID=A0A163EI20_9BACL|nr:MULTISPECIES: MFS transporter [Paenibacillus]EFU40207.1 major facilitator superfamily MFS_1 [Paenibacillus vortex V453]KZS43817.1 MFS transporter [Paenibacillus glucanolyticus]
MNEMKAKQPLWTKEFITLMVSNLFLFLTLQMMLTTLPAYAKETFMASPLQVSLITSLFAFSAIASRFVSSRALEKGKLRLLLYVGLLISLAATLGYYWASGIVFLLLMRILFGIGFGMTSTSFPTMASDVIPIKRLGEGMGYFGLSTTLAMSIGPMIGLTLLQGGGFTPLVIITVIINVLIFPLAYILTSRAPARRIPERPVTEPVHLEDKPRSSFNSKLILPSVLNFLMSITYGGLLSFMALYGAEAHLRNPQYFFLFNAIAIILVRPFSGRIYDRYGHKALVVPAAALMVSGLLLLTFASSTGTMLLSALCYGLGFGAIQPSIQTWMIQEVHPLQRGMANGMFFNSLDFGVAIGSIVLGSIAKSTSYAIMYRYSALALALLILIYILAHIIGKSRSKARTRLEETKSAAAGS